MRKTVHAIVLILLAAMSCTTSPDPRQIRLPTAPAASGKILFDGHTLDGWRVIDYAGGGEIEIHSNSLILGMGATLTGLTYTNSIPASDYEISLLAARLEGTDFFCGLTFPVAGSFCTLILGGWGGAVVGLSSIDGEDASMNATTQYRRFERGRFYSVRVRVTKAAIEVWLDGEQIIRQGLEGHTINLRPGEIEACAPFGVATWQTTGALQEIRLTPLH